MIRYSVIGGYLGAGKTTLLNQILRRRQSARFGLLINDFGELNIDADLIESQTDAQINLTNGCVCCTLVDGFHTALEQITAYRPEHIIVEASGVADVANLAQYGHGHGLVLDSVLVVADAETIQRQASDPYVGRTVQRQLRAADLIILSKCDLISQQAQQDVRAWLSETASDIGVVASGRADVPLELLFGLHEADSVPVLEPLSHEAYATWHFQRDVVATREGCEELLRHLPRFVLRAKGLVRTADGALELQAVGSRSSLTPRASCGTSLVAIGLARDFDAAQLDRLAAEYLGC